MLRRTLFSGIFAIYASLVLGSSGFCDIPFDKFTSNAPLDGEAFTFINTNSGRCLTVKDGEVKQGVMAEAATSQERWMLVRAGDYYNITNVKTHQMLTVPGNSGAQGTNLVLADAIRDDGSSQQWIFEKVGQHYVIKSRISGLVMAVADQSKVEGTRVVQWTWMGIRDQVWMIQWVPGCGKE